MASVCSEAALRGRISARPVGRSDPEESDSDSAVRRRHAGSAAGAGEGVRATMGRCERHSGVRHSEAEGQSPLKLPVF